jgi:alpha-tubulin suppressor-like RCC1 family protein
MPVKFSIVVAMLILLYSHASAYETCKTSGGADIKWSTSGATYYINTYGGPSEGLSAIIEGMRTWTDVSTSIFTFVYGGTTSSTAYGVLDRTNIVTFGLLESGILAQNSYWYYPSSGEIVDSDIQFNTAYTWDTSESLGSYDVQNIGTHEFGHSLCLSDLYNSSDSEKTMYGYASPEETKKRNLDQDDIDGITYLYPCPYGGLICKEWLFVETGETQTVAIKSDGTLWAWGQNNYGQLGDGTNIDKNIPVQIGTDNTWRYISAGSDTLALKSDGTLWAWGRNNYGQLGDGSTIDKNTPVQIGTGNTWKYVSAGGNHTIALKSDGMLWAWGRNNYGQLGDGTTTNKNIPVQIGADHTWRYISAGNYHTIALKSDGTLWGWGWNLFGQLGDGTNTNRKIPVQIGTDNTWSSISAGANHTIALKSDGTLWAWGYNGSGQLGDGTNTNRNVPVQIGTDNTWSYISAGSDTIALKSDGTLWAWGNNSYGQLGDGTNTNRNVPVQIGTGDTWGYISAGNNHTVALKSDGTLWAWGWNLFGQLGDGTNTDKNYQITVDNPPDAEAGWSYTGTEGQSLTLDGSASTDSDGSIAEYEWDVDNDGTYDYTSTTSSTQSHTYAQNGVYTVRLRVTDNLGAAATATTTAIIYDTVPTASFTATPTSGTAPLTVNFTNTSTGYDAPLTNAWDLDNDGTTDSTLQDPSFIYNAGTYTVNLTVTDADGSTNTLTWMNYISVCYSNATIVGSTDTYSSLQSAYNAAADGDTIQGRDVTIAEDIDFNLDKTVTIQGGYNCDHSAVTGKTVISGTMTISNGTLTIENLELQ